MGAASTRTMLFTDIEGSTALLQRVGPQFAELLARHNDIMRAAIRSYEGVERSNEGDSFTALFPTVSGALLAALQAQLGLHLTPWPENADIRVRMGVHVGDVADTPAGLVGLALHQAARIASSAHGGQVVLSEAARLLVVDRLPAGAGLRPLGEHRLRDVGAIGLYQLTYPALPSEFPPLRADSGARHNLPAPLTTLIGRDDEAAAIEKLLDGHRLVTLIGAGGCGKTRLALRAAAEWLSRATADVWLVELASVAAEGFVAGAVTKAIIGHGSAGDAQSAAVDAIRGRQTLLVFDNCEHVLAACAQLVDALLRQCPELRVLATSREPLGVSGESVFRVPSLAVPRPGSRLDDILAADAVRLFEERACLVAPGYAVSAADGDAVVEICRRLDGMPLAIELAAARVRVLEPAEIADKLSDVFRVATGGSRTSLPRHQTLQATIDWSYGLLSPDEQILLDRLCVFQGGASLDAVAAICSGSGVNAGDVLDLVTSLHDKSLIVVTFSPNGSRTSLSEIIRQYAGARLADRDETERLGDRHAAWFTGLADELFNGPVDGRMGAWRTTHEIEADNLDAAARWSLGSDDDRALHIVAARALGSELLGHPERSVTLFRETLARKADGPPQLVTALRWGLMRADFEYGSVGESDFAHLEQDAARAGDAFSLALAAWARACDEPFALGHPPRSTFDEVIALADGASRPLFQAFVRLDISSISPPPCAVALVEEAVSLVQEHGLHEFAWLCQWAMAKAYGHVGDSLAATRAVRAALEGIGALSLGNRLHLAAGVGFVEAEHGDLDVACALVEDASVHAWSPTTELKVHSVLAHVYRLTGRITEGRDEAVRALALLPHPPTEFFEVLASVTLAGLDCDAGQPAIGARRLAALWRGGRHWSGAGDYPQRFIEELAGCAQALRREQETADLLATAARRRSAEGKPIAPNRQPIVKAITSPATGRILGDDDIQAVADTLALS